MSKFGLYGKCIAQPGKRDELAQVLLEAASLMEAVEGCELYVVNITDEEPDAIWVTEVWVDQAAHQGSLTLESTKMLIQRGRPLIAGMEQIKLQTLGGKGIK
ncbi:MAG: antibiotic biosynthesis monooxygenase [Paenibacillus sp.]|jgi:quinol monooxygenase YgiN|nr:antibiotic biosynthesis monooxygenase [Paenibacillus sp.]